eukprot:TRINITY_DN12790_c0_g1_i1.p1 TRINITY_DN12790_c0_g1~~TRINITY_DN12790_c0_g1_i1.p1  ORF type:complete len:175 (+),score=23.76 TRINITY_DN12790_c0_g1_i1:77-526(+)
MTYNYNVNEDVSLREVVHETGMARAEMMVSELDDIVSEDILSEIGVWSVLIAMLSLTVWCIVSFETCPEWACEFSNTEPSLHRYFIELPLYPVRVIACLFPDVSMQIVCGASVTAPLMCVLVIFKRILDDLSSFEGYGQMPPDSDKKNN